MVEHRTENSGVRGSNPFTGNMSSKSKLFYYAICSQFVLESHKARNELSKNIELEKISVESRLSRLREFGFVSRVLQLTLHIPNNIIFNNTSINTKKTCIIKIRGRRNVKTETESNTWKKTYMPTLALYLPLVVKKYNDHWNPYSVMQNSWMLNKYAGGLVNIYTGLHLNFVFINLRKISKNDNYLLVAKAVNSKKLLGPFYHKYKQFFLNWFTKLTFLKDPSGITGLVASVLLHSHLKKHRVIFFKINRILKIWYYYLSVKYNIKGYSFFFKGKLGKKGSVKKTKFFRKFGSTSFTNKNVRVNYKMYEIITITGVIGAGLHVYYKGLFTLTLLYILYYILNLIQILWYFEAHKLIKSLTQLSFSNAWQGISNYVANGWVFKFLILQLAGLPPFFSFFLKVNLLSLSLKYTNIFLIILIFCNLLMSVFFYLQIFSTTNVIHSKLILKTLASESSMIDAKKESRSMRKYNFYLFFCTMTFFSTFSIIFFFDLFAIVYAFTM